MKQIIRHDVRTASGIHRVEQRVDLDEVIVPGIHIEDMGDHWHVALGNSALVCSVNKRTRRVTIVEENKVRR